MQALSGVSQAFIKCHKRRRQLMRHPQICGIIGSELMVKRQFPLSSRRDGVPVNFQIGKQRQTCLDGLHHPDIDQTLLRVPLSPISRPQFAHRNISHFIIDEHWRMKFMIGQALAQQFTLNLTECNGCQNTTIHHYRRSCGVG